MVRRLSRAPKAPRQSPQPAPQGERVPLGLRVTRETKRRLDDAATASGRSQSQEAELRLEQSFEAEKIALSGLDLRFGRHWTGILLAIAQAAQNTGTRALMVSRWNFEGCEDWVLDPYAYDQAMRAAVFLLEHFRPKGEAKPGKFARSQFHYLPDQALEALGEGFAQALLSTRKQRNPKMVLNEIADAIWQRLKDLPSQHR
jgi:hypothetical protein